jgi:hypothetical protein
MIQVEANAQGERHLASCFLGAMDGWPHGLYDARADEVHCCTDLTSFADCSSESIPQGVEKRQHISLTARDVPGVVFDGPELC